MRIKSLTIENFTIFIKEKLTFSDGLNIIVGENDTGKSHLLRLLYSLIESNNLVVQQKGANKRHLLQKSIPQKLMDIFNPEELAHLNTVGFSFPLSGCLCFPCLSVAKSGLRNINYN